MILISLIPIQNFSVLLAGDAYKNDSYERKQSISISSGPPSRGGGGQGECHSGTVRIYKYIIYENMRIIDFLLTSDRF